MQKNRLNAKHSNGFLVGLAGLEPATFRPPDGRATRLRHSPLMTGSTVFPGGGKGVFPVFFCGSRFLSGSQDRAQLCGAVRDLSLHMRGQPRCMFEKGENICDGIGRGLRGNWLGIRCRDLWHLLLHDRRGHLLSGFC